MSAPDSPRPGFPIVWILLFAALAAGAMENLEAAWLGGFCGYLFGRLRIVAAAARLVARRGRPRDDVRERAAAAAAAAGLAAAVEAARAWAVQSGIPRTEFYARAVLGQ